MYWRILKKCILRISMPTLSKPLPSPHKEATVLTHKITSSSCLSCFCDLPRRPPAPKLDFSGRSSSGLRSWSPLSNTTTLCWFLSWRASRLGRLCTWELSSHTPPLSLSRASATAMGLTSPFFLFLQCHQRHLPRALSHATALLRNLQQECPTTRQGPGFSAQSFMVWPHPTLQIISSPLRCSNSPPHIHCLILKLCPPAVHMVTPIQNPPLIPVIPLQHKH